jgi:hypothetical protein
MRFASVRNRNLASDLLALESVNIEIGFPSAASAGAARWFDFDANAQSRTLDLKVQEERSSTCSCPTPCPTGIFAVFCLHYRTNKNPANTGLS